MKEKVINNTSKLTFLHKIQAKINKIISFIKEIDIDFIFLFLALFVLAPNLSILYNLLGSIGLMYLYKLLKEDIIQVIIRGKMK